MVGAGTDLSTASSTVHRPSPESSTYGLRSSSFGSAARAAAAHQAVAVLQSPDAAAGAGVDVGQAARGQLLAAPDVVLPLRVTPVDDRVAALEHPGERPDRRLRRLAGGDHHPHRARGLEG